MNQYNVLNALLVLVVSFSAHSQSQQLDFAQLLQQNPKQAKRVIDRVMDGENVDADAYYWCGRIYGKLASAGVFSGMRYAGTSRDCLERAVAQEPNNIHYRKGLFYYYLGAPSIVGGGFEPAKQQVEQVKAFAPTEGYLLEVELQLAHGTHKTIQDTFDNARKAHPDSAQITLKYSHWLQSERRFHQATEILSALRNSLLAASKQSDEQQYSLLQTHYQLGRTAVMSGENTEQGIVSLQRYILNYVSHSDLPERHWAAVRLAQLLLVRNELDDFNTAMTLLNQAKLDGKDDQTLQQLIVDITQTNKTDGTQG